MSIIKKIGSIIVIIIIALFILLQNNFLSFITSDNYKLFALLTSSFFFLISITIIVLAVRGDYYDGESEKNSNWDKYSPVIISIIIASILVFLGSKYFMGFLDEPIEISGECVLYEKVHRKSVNSYEISIDGYNYDVGYDTWINIERFGSTCTGDNGCKCKNEVKVIVLPKMMIALEVIET